MSAHTAWRYTVPRLRSLDAVAAEVPEDDPDSNSSAKHLGQVFSVVGGFGTRFVKW